MKIQNETSLIDRTVLAKTTFLGDFFAYSYKDGLSASNLSLSTAKKLERASQKRLLKSNSREYYQSSAPLQVSVPGLRHSQIEIGECIGEGSFSSVYTIKSIRRNTSPKKVQASKCVIKILKKDLVQNPAMMAACAADMAKEGYIMASLAHPHVLSVQAWTPTGLAGLKSGRHDAFFLVLAKLDDTLGDRLKQWKKHQKAIKYSLVQRGIKKTNFLKERLQVALHLADAVAYLHSQHILHRDLKPENIGFDGLGILKVFDFDVARIVVMPTHADSNTTFLFTKKVGSPRYMSPECARGEAYNLKSDVYTFALLLHELLSLEKPYDDIAACDHLYQVFLNGVRPFVPLAWPLPIQTLIQNAWSEDIRSRPPMQQIHQVLLREIPIMVAEKKSRLARSMSFRSSSSSSPTSTLPQLPIPVGNYE
jgi:serine/threonine protein kinase